MFKKLNLSQLQELDKDDNENDKNEAIAQLSCQVHSKMAKKPASKYY